MPALEESTLECKEASQAFLQEALLTLPFNPDSLDVRMVADGIQLPGCKEEGGHARYLSECEQNQVIPFSRLKITYDYHIEGFWPEKYDNPVLGYFGPRKPEDKDRSAVMQGLINGGRIYCYDIALGEGSLHELQDEVFRPMIENKYHFAERGYINAYKESLGLSFHANSKMIQLFRGDRFIPDQDRMKVTDWFNGLIAKHTALPFFEASPNE